MGATLSLEQCPALVLNADYRPLSYFPLSLWSWQDAIKAIYREAVDVISVYDRSVHSPSQEMKLPSVVVLKEYIPQARRPAFTRFNVFLRDGFACQYCAERKPAKELTFDHLIPRSRGGRTTWENIITACRPCNTKKGSRLMHECKMFPQLKPVQPTIYELQARGKQFPPNFLHESWGDYLYWDSVLETE